MILVPILCLAENKKDTSLSIEKRVYDKSLELIYQNADSALSYGLNAMGKIGVPEDSANYANLLKVMGAAAQWMGKYEQALKFHRESAIIFEKLKLTASHAACLTNMAIVFYMIDQYEEAIYYNNQSLILYQKVDSSTNKIANCYNALGLIYSEIKQLDSANFYYNKALDLFDEDNLDRALVYENLGALKEYSGQFDEALIYYLKAELLHEKHKDYSGLAWTLNHIGTIYNEMGWYAKARVELRQALEYSKEYGLINEQKDITNSIFQSYLGEGNVDSSTYYFSEYKSLNDSINTERLNKNIQEMEVKYQVEKKEAALSLSNEKSARLTAENKTNELFLSGAVVLLVLLAGGFFIANRNYQQKRQITMMNLELKDKELKDMLTRQEAESLNAMLKGQEEERERVAKDLHDRLGGTLVALKMAMRRPENKVEKAELEMLDGAVVELRNIAHNLSAGVMEKAGLKVALQELKSTIERSGDLKFNLFLSADTFRVKHEVAIELYRIIQELTNNTLKHAQASEVNLQASVNAASFNLIFEDNGVGFLQESMEEGMGMRNIRARVEKINGQMHIDSQVGRGTIVIIEIERA